MIPHLVAQCKHFFLQSTIFLHFQSYSARFILQTEENIPKHRWKTRLLHAGQSLRCGGRPKGHPFRRRIFGKFTNNFYIYRPIVSPVEKKYSTFSTTGFSRTRLSALL